MSIKGEQTAPTVNTLSVSIGARPSISLRERKSSRHHLTMRFKSEEGLCCRESIRDKMPGRRQWETLLVPFPKIVIRRRVLGMVMLVENMSKRRLPRRL